jgi:hypothetical protein
MPTVHTRYVTWISRGRRHHGSAAADLVAPLSTGETDGNTYQAWASPSITWTDGTGEHTASFAFWSVTGSADGASVSTNTSLTVNVGSSDVAATAWYIPTGGNGGPGVLIDAFDVNQGNFVDDDFVDVVTDPTMTFVANDEGWVPTMSAAEDIRAYTSIHAVPFTDWTVVLGSEAVSNEDLDAAQNTSAVAFAFYQTPSVVIKKPDRIEHGLKREFEQLGKLIAEGDPWRQWEEVELVQLVAQVQTLEKTVRRLSTLIETRELPQVGTRVAKRELAESAAPARARSTTKSRGSSPA